MNDTYVVDLKNVDRGISLLLAAAAALLAFCVGEAYKDLFDLGMLMAGIVTVGILSFFWKKKLVLPVEQAKKGRGEKIVQVFVLTISSALLVHIVLSNPYTMMNYLFISYAIAMLCWGKWIQKVSVTYWRSLLTAWMLGTMLLTLAVFLLVLRPITVGESQEILEEAGYTELYFNHGIDGKQLRHWEDLGEAVLEEPLKLGGYVYRVQGAGEESTVIVSVSTGEIFEEAPMSD